MSKFLTVKKPVSLRAANFRKQNKYNMSDLDIDLNALLNGMTAAPVSPISSGNHHLFISSLTSVTTSSISQASTPIPPYSFSSSASKEKKSSLKAGGKVHVCSSSGCEFMTNRKDKIVLHERTHNGERPFKCLECDFSSRRKDKLVVHMRKHNKERPYACLRCDYRASKQCKLKQHMRTHTGERPYVCTVDGCAFSSSQPANLSTHHKKSHPDLFICREKGCTFVTADGSDTLTAHKIVTHKDSASHFTELFN